MSLRHKSQFLQGRDKGFVLWVLLPEDLKENRLLCYLASYGNYMTESSLRAVPSGFHKTDSFKRSIE